MSKQNQKTQSQPKGALPSHRVYLVQDGGEDRKDSWTEIGAIWPHKDGKGGSIGLKLSPVEMLIGNARIVYREVKQAQNSAQDKAA